MKVLKIFLFTILFVTTMFSCSSDNDCNLPEPKYEICITPYNTNLIDEVTIKTTVTNNEVIEKTYYSITKETRFPIDKVTTNIEIIAKRYSGMYGMKYALYKDNIKIHNDLIYPGMYGTIRIFDFIKRN